MTDQDALVIFTPSGKRGRFALGTPVLTAARQLGVDLEAGRRAAEERQGERKRCKQKCGGENPPIAQTLLNLLSGN